MPGNGAVVARAEGVEPPVRAFGQVLLAFRDLAVGMLGVGSICSMETPVSFLSASA
jgi:hypothetical protein